MEETDAQHQERSGKKRLKFIVESICSGEKNYLTNLGKSADYHLSNTISPFKQWLYETLGSVLRISAKKRVFAMQETSSFMCCQIRQENLLGFSRNLQLCCNSHANWKTILNA